ncbi:MAG: hypothetical protein OYH77_04865 [Pseudomonadota bacterium]|nr:hypothetical protein [Pseudomonadota bacterium]
MQVVLLFWLLICASACFTTHKLPSYVFNNNTPQGMTTQTNPTPTLPIPDLATNPANTAEEQPPVQLATAIPTPVDTCKSYTSIGSKLPAFIGEHGFVLTAVQRPCITFAGESGFYSDSSWVAMGMPCSGGGGTVEWEGKEERPKTVTLALTTDCPMQPTAKQVAGFGVSHLGFDSTDKLIAYNPLILQFWSLPAYPDAGTGYGVMVRSRKAVDMVWYRLKKKTPINIHLYGRENSWSKGNNIYFINANIIGTTDYRFRLEVLAVRHLSNMEISEARRRCDMLRPKPNCQLIF